VVIEEVQAEAVDSGGRTLFRPDTPRVVVVGGIKSVKAGAFQAGSNLT
jgi:hypothetical protein